MFGLFSTDSCAQSAILSETVQETYDVKLNIMRVNDFYVASSWRAWQIVELVCVPASDGNQDCCHLGLLAQLFRVRLGLTEGIKLGRYCNYLLEQRQDGFQTASRPSDTCGDSS